MKWKCEVPKSKEVKISNARITKEMGRYEEQKNMRNLLRMFDYKN